MSSEWKPGLETTRSPHLMNPSDTLVLVIDVQDRLWPAIDGHATILPRMTLLLRAAKELSIPIVATEQYPKGLGGTIDAIRPLVGKPIEKMAFSAGIEPSVLADLDRPGLRKILIVGIEAHVCVLQTALDLLASGYQVYLAVDAVGSRRASDKQAAIQRMAGVGITPVTTESAVFEWTVVSGTDVFKRMSKLVKEVPIE